MQRFWVCLVLAGCAATAAPAPRVASLPAGDVMSVDGQHASLKAALAGSVAVVDLWATWCTACEHERPKLERLHAAYAARGLRVVGLNVGEAPGVVSAYLLEQRIAYPVYLDPDFRLADALGEKKLPTILVIDREGHIAHRSAGLDSEALAEVKRLLAQPGP